MLVLAIIVLVLIIEYGLFAYYDTYMAIAPNVNWLNSECNIKYPYSPVDVYRMECLKWGRPDSLDTRAYGRAVWFIDKPESDVHTIEVEDVFRPNEFPFLNNSVLTYWVTVPKEHIEVYKNIMADSLLSKYILWNSAKSSSIGVRGPNRRFVVSLLIALSFAMNDQGELESIFEGIYSSNGKTEEKEEHIVSLLFGN
jgi:hypothetical protein